MSALLNPATELHPHALRSTADVVSVQNPPTGAAGARQSARPLVVVAEDRADARTMVGIMLASFGFDVVLTADGVDALDAVFTHGPDAVVCDMDMPNLDGLGLCRALRALRANESLPIIVYTGADCADPRLRDAHALHGAEIIGKSLAVTEIGELLRRLITVVGGSAAA